ncbi:MAG: hypothetical protein ABJA81_13075, partial [Nocardioidaceae bacterium]
MTATTASGCCGYQASGSGANVVSAFAGHLALWRRQTGEPFVAGFSTGRGDIYRGMRCGPGHTLVTRTADLTGPTEQRLQITLEVLRGVVVRTHVERVVVGSQRSDLWTSTHCPRLSTSG